MSALYAGVSFRGQTKMTSPPNQRFDEDRQTELSERVARPAAEGARFAVEVFSGPDAGQSLAADPAQPARLLVGQSKSCDLQLTDPRVSRRHLALEVVGEQLRVTDLGSTNGTRIHGLLVAEAFVGGGESIEIGETVLAVRREAEVSSIPLTAASNFGRTLGASQAMRRLYPLCERLAATSVPVVIEGETGTGKEVLAESLHEQGPRAKGAFVVFDCTAVPPNLMEASLFGHERGAFTGATDARKGVFEEADGGTLLIDEIGDLDIELQAKLLRALERGEVRRIGGKGWIRVDVRILAATRRDLDEAVQAGIFRDDLFYRLAVARIELPPLRKRDGDVALLAQHFWRRLADPGAPIPPELVQRLQRYSWPGNVRELHNAVARHVALGDLAFTDGSSREAPLATRPGRVPRPSTAPLADPIEQVLELDLPFPRARQRVLNEFETRYLERVLAKHGGNVMRAAAASGIARRYFQILRARSRKQEAG